MRKRTGYFVSAALLCAMAVLAPAQGETRSHDALAIARAKARADNQRVLLLGLGTSETVPAVEVTWPSGRRQVFEGLPLDGEVVLVEGRAGAFRLPGLESSRR